MSFRVAGVFGSPAVAELVDGRSQLLAYNVVRSRLHTRCLPRLHQLGRRARRLARSPQPPRVTLLCFSRAPIERLTAYKQRMGWGVPYVSTYNTDFAFDFGLALKEEQAEQIPEVKQMLDNPPDWLEEWRRTSASCSSGRRSLNPTSPARGGRTSTRTDA